eukprot:scaffold1307_cov200-Pinguiococcus_pyrenoidosus.AAC.129
MAGIGDSTTAVGCAIRPGRTSSTATSQLCVTALVAHAACSLASGAPTLPQRQLPRGAVGAFTEGRSVATGRICGDASSGNQGTQPRQVLGSYSTARFPALPI